MSTTTDKVMGGYSEAEHNKALGNLLADAKATPAAEAMDWRKGCIVEKAKDGMWNVHSPSRSSWLMSSEPTWSAYSEYGNTSAVCGVFYAEQEARHALATCTTPYPNFIPSAIEAARNADIGDGLGLDHDQSRRTMGATLAKMPELARKPNPTNSLRIVGKLAMKPVPGGFDLFNAMGTRVASMSVGWLSHMDPAMQQTQDQAKAIGQALVDLWNADYDATTQQVADDVREKIRDDRN